MKQLAKSKYLVFLVLIIALNFTLSGFFTDFIQQGLVGLYLLLKSILFLAGLFLLIRYLIQIGRNGDVSNPAKNVFTSMLSFGLVLHVIEFVFLFIPISNHTQLSLASWTWEAYYNRDMNELGFRDQPVSGRVENDRKKVFFVGDSYTEGFGLKHTKHRFSNIVATKLGKDYEVFNLGKSGVSTREEFQFLQQIPFKPDIIIWQYFFNDIQDICIDQLKYFPDLNPYRNLNFLSEWIVSRSYLFNYLFFKFCPLTIYEDYAAFFKTCASDPGTQESYLNLLTEIRNYCDSREIKLYFVIIPIPVNPQDSKKQDDLVRDYLDLLDILVIPTDNLMTIPESRRVVSGQDMHLSKESNEVLANLIYSSIKGL